MYEKRVCRWHGDNQWKKIQRLRPTSWTRLIIWTFCLSLTMWVFVAYFDQTKVQKIDRCLVPWQSLSVSSSLRICITTLSDANVESKYKKSARRDFNDVLEATWDNKKRYADQNAYQLFNASNLIDIQRPPSWSKILAVQSAFNANCDWVFWMDSDSLIMNSNILIENVLPTNPSADLIITKDVTGCNAGMWILRNSPWAHDFLNDWWSMTDFMRPPGDTKSGDNDALKSYMSHLSDFDKHVLVAPQCAFNSYLWIPGVKSWIRYVWNRKIVEDGLYLKGDFLIHFAGVDNKMDLINKYKKNAV